MNSKKKLNRNGLYCINKKDATDKQTDANKFNEFYVNIGPTYTEIYLRKIVNQWMTLRSKSKTNEMKM